MVYLGTPCLQRKLKKTAVPSQFSWTKPSSSTANERKARYEKWSSSKNHTTVLVHKSNNESDIKINDIHDDAVAEVVEIPEANELTNDQWEMDAINIQSDQPHLTTVCTQTEMLSRAKYDIDDFITDDAGIHFFTGLENYLKFKFVLNTLGPAAYCLNYIYHNVGNISVENQFFLVLMKLRRATTNFELSRIFSISESTVSNIFLTWINFMNVQWKELDLWPPQELVRYFAPSGFKQTFPSTRVIIDGTEVPVKRPKNPKSQQATFSVCKNKNTVKVIVGATPGGLVSYVSPAYAGSTSDRQIIERSSLMKDCDSKDSIMADKGFNVQDLFAPYDVAINIPTFFKNMNRMSGRMVMKDRKISSKRVHIERIIGLAKTFKILTQPMSATVTKMASEVIFIVFMLCNFRKNIVPTNA